MASYTETYADNFMEMLNAHLEKGFEVNNTTPSNLRKPETTTSTTANSEANRTENIQISLFFSSVGFLLGFLVAFIFFRQKFKAVKAEYEVRIDEARTSIDRMLKIAAQQSE